MSALVALLAVGVVLLAVPPAVPRPRRPSRREPRRAVSGVVAVRATALVAGVAVALVVGGGMGVLLGMAAGTAVAVVVPRLRSRAALARADAVARQAPLVVDLVSACLASGASLEAAVAAGARAVGGQAGETLLRAAAALHLGADPSAVWDDVAREPALAGLARAVRRSQATGAPLSDLLPRVAAEARAAQRTRAEARTRTAAVRLTAPLGAAFLPAFVLLGVVPVVASWVGALL